MESVFGSASQRWRRSFCRIRNLKILGGYWWLVCCWDESNLVHLPAAGSWGSPGFRCRVLIYHCGFNSNIGWIYLKMEYSILDYIRRVWSWRSHTLAATSHKKEGLVRLQIPKWPYFMLVNFYNWPRNMVYICWWITIIYYNSYSCWYVCCICCLVVWISWAGALLGDRQCSELQVFSYIKHSGIEILSPACIFVLHCAAANFPLANTIQKAVSTAFFKVCRKILLEFPAKKSVRCGSGELIDPIIRSGIGDGVVSQ